MQRVLGRRSAAVLVAIAIFLAPTAELRATIARFDTTAGTIDVRLYNTATPMSVDNFLGYVNTDRYDGTFIHRNAIVEVSEDVFEPFVIQGGGFLLNDSIFAATLIDQDDPVMNEPGILNGRGTFAYAKGSDPDSATSQWFFNLRDNTSLDSPANAGGFTVFGRVLGNGMEVVDAIAALPIIDASVAENGPAEAFEDVPVFDADKVLDQNDITNEDAVIINSIDVLDVPAGDYDFDGMVTMADFIVWRNTQGSMTMAEADGNGDGTINDADYDVWQASFGETMGGGSSGTVPEPSSAALFVFGVWLAGCGWRGRNRDFRS